MLDRAVIGIAQWLPRPGDAAGNLAAALELIAGLGRHRCDLIVLPELWPSGYSPASLAGDVARSAEPLDGPRTSALARAAASAGAWLAAGSVPERDGAEVYNTGLLFGRDGELRGVHRKAHLYAPLGEDLIFTAGPRLTVCPTQDFGPLGLPVCFDGDFPETARALRLAGARVVVQASAYEAEAESWWDGLYPARALENGQWWVMSNQCGQTPSGTLLGGSQIISPLGRVVSRAAKVHEPAGPALLVAEIALREELACADRLNAALWENRRPELYDHADVWVARHLPVPGRSLMDVTAHARPPTAGLESRSIDYVPVSERHGKIWHLGPLWFAGNAQLATIAIGAFGIAGGLSFSWSIVAIVLGALIGTLFMAFHSAQGPKLGLPQMIQSRPQFGYYGAILPVVVAVLLFIGFNVFNTQLAETTAAQTLNVNPTTGAIIMAALSYAFAIFGYRLIHVFCQWASVLFIVVYVLFGIGLAVAVHLPAGFYSFGTFKGTPFLLETGAILSYQLTWAPYVSEYSRYLPRRSSTAATFWWTYIGSGIGILWLAGLGAYLAAAYPKIVSPVTAIHVAGNSWFHGWGYIVLLCSYPGLIAVIGLNMYSGGLSTLTTIDSVRPVRPTLTLRVLAITFIAVAGTVLALTLPGSFLTNFSSFLTIILYFMIPWTAVNLIDFFFVRKGNYAIKEIFKPGGMYHRWGWRGLSAYWLGFFTMAPFMSTTLYTGFVAHDLGGADISPFIGFPVAAILYWVFCRNLDVVAEKRVAEEQMHEVDPEGSIGLSTG